MSHALDLKKKRSSSVEPDEDQEDKTRSNNKKQKSVKITYKHKLSNGSVLEFCPDKCNDYYHHYSFKLNSLQDLVALDEFYTARFDKTKTSNLQFSTIHRIVPAVKKLLQLVGMDDAKRSILYIISYYMQKLDTENQEMLHTVIYGVPGCGKTRLCQVLADIYAGLGVLPTNKTTFVKRADLVAGYLGQTATKTKKVIDEAMGGILVIDEAYSLGDKEQRDSFSRECIDTLNQYLSERKGEFICVIAGYKEDLEERFFKTNPGLERRFPIRFHLSKYNPPHLRDIFHRMVAEQGWRIDEDASPLIFFERNHDLFEFQGGDMELLFGKVKLEHGLRLFGQAPEDRKRITKEDVEAGMEQFVTNRQKKPENNLKDIMNMMYV